MRDDDWKNLKFLVNAVCILLVIASGRWMIKVESAPLWLGKIVFWAFFVAPLAMFLSLNARAVTRLLFWLLIFIGISLHDS